MKLPQGQEETTEKQYILLLTHYNGFNINLEETAN